MAFWAAFFPLETGAIEFLHLELLRVDVVEAAYVKHHHVLAPGPFAIGVGLDAASLAKTVMDRAVVELVVRHVIFVGKQFKIGLRNGRQQRAKFAAS
jgi:hypothetical protein